MIIVFITTIKVFLAKDSYTEVLGHIMCSDVAESQFQLYTGFYSSQNTFSSLTKNRLFVTKMSQIPDRRQEILIKPLRTQGKENIYKKENASPSTYTERRALQWCPSESEWTWNLKKVNKLLVRIPQDDQGHGEQGKTEKLLQTKDWRDMTTKRNVVCWMRSLNTQRKNRKTDEI